MAVGTITVQNVNPAGGPFEVLGDRRVTVNQVVPTSGANYAVGGVPITAAQLGLTRVLWAHVDVITQAATVGPSACAALAQADGSVLLKCNLAAGNADNASNANLSASLVQIIAYGY